MPNEIISATPDLIIHRMPEMTSLVTITVVISNLTLDGKPYSVTAHEIYVAH